MRSGSGGWEALKATAVCERGVSKEARESRDKSRSPTGRSAREIFTEPQITLIKSEAGNGDTSVNTGPKPLNNAAILLDGDVANQRTILQPTTRTVIQQQHFDQRHVQNTLNVFNQQVFMAKTQAESLIGVLISLTLFLSEMREHGERSSANNNLAHRYASSLPQQITVQINNNPTIDTCPIPTTVVHTIVT